MSNLERVQEVLEECPVLYFEYQTDIGHSDTDDGMGDFIKEQYIVDRSQKKAEVFSVFGQNGSQAMVTTIYENEKVRHYYHGMAPDDEIAFLPGEYEALFAKNGKLWPVNAGVLLEDEQKLDAVEVEKAAKGTWQILDRKSVQFTLKDENSRTSLRIRLLSGKEPSENNL